MLRITEWTKGRVMMNKLDSRSAHVFHALTEEPNRFRLVRLSSKASRIAWSKDKVQSENINGMLRVIGKEKKGEFRGE